MFMGSNIGNIVLNQSLPPVVRIRMSIRALAITHRHEGEAAMIYTSLSTLSTKFIPCNCDNSLTTNFCVRCRQVCCDDCRNLEHLDLLGLDQIEGDSFTHIPEQLPRLTLLILVQCNRVSISNML